MKPVGLFGLLLFVVVALELASFCHGLTEEQRAAVLEYHNAYRRNKGVPELTYGTSFASVAENYAASCPNGHSSNDYGENLFWAFGDVPADLLKMAVDSWYSEVSDYDCETNTCNGRSDAGWLNCGHYTQIMWNETTQVACGLNTQCPDSALVVVCNYSPSGNLYLLSGEFARPFNVENCQYNFEDKEESSNDGAADGDGGGGDGSAAASISRWWLW
ncbi:SCP domain-containing protein [Balamuthia mandrillaris]